MLQMKIKTGRRTVAPGDLPSILGARRAYRELGDMVEAEEIRREQSSNTSSFVAEITGRRMAA